MMTSAARSDFGREVLGQKPRTRQTPRRQRRSLFKPHETAERACGGTLGPSDGARTPGHQDGGRRALGDERGPQRCRGSDSDAEPAAASFGRPARRGTSQGMPRISSGQRSRRLPRDGRQRRHHGCERCRMHAILSEAPSTDREDHSPGWWRRMTSAGYARPSPSSIRGTTSPRSTCTCDRGAWRPCSHVSASAPFAHRMAASSPSDGWCAVHARAAMRRTSRGWSSATSAWRALSRTHTNNPIASYGPRTSSWPCWFTSCARRSTPFLVGFACC